MTEAEYITNSSGILDRYNRILAIIIALENQQIASVTNSDIDEYQINDGQTTIRTKYRSADMIARAIDTYDKIANRLHAQMTGQRVMRLADAESLQSNMGANGRFR